jgi:hypothetical protein
VSGVVNVSGNFSINALVRTIGVESKTLQQVTLNISGNFSINSLSGQAGGQTVLGLDLGTLNSGSVNVTGNFSIFAANQIIAYGVYLTGLVGGELDVSGTFAIVSLG